MRPRSLTGTRRHVAAELIALVCTPASHALQIVDARDGVAVEAILSVREPTRIRIEGSPISDVFGNIHSSSCGGAAAGGAAAGGTAVGGACGGATGAPGWAYVACS